jgi:hypothetical protein
MLNDAIYARDQVNKFLGLQTDFPQLHMRIGKGLLCIQIPLQIQ